MCAIISAKSIELFFYFYKRVRPILRRFINNQSNLINPQKTKMYQNDTFLFYHFDTLYILFSF
jgi:hypothetical protein